MKVFLKSGYDITITVVEIQNYGILTSNNIAYFKVIDSVRTVNETLARRINTVASSRDIIIKDSLFTIIITPEKLKKRPLKKEFQPVYFKSANLLYSDTPE